MIFPWFFISTLFYLLLTDRDGSIFFNLICCWYFLLAIVNIKIPSQNIAQANELLLIFSRCSSLELPMNKNCLSPRLVSFQVGCHVTKLSWRMVMIYTYTVTTALATFSSAISSSFTWSSVSTKWILLLASL